MQAYLTTEGTYPYVVGGVSTWAHNLVQALGEVHFRVGAVIDNPFHSLAYQLPANVTLEPLPLWGFEVADEQLAVPAPWRRALRTSPAEVKKRFLPCWEGFIDALATNQASSGALGNAFAEVVSFAGRYDLRKALAAPLSWAALVKALRSHPLLARLPLKEVIDFGKALARFLLPLTVPVPPCDVAHASAAGLCALPAIAAKHRHGARLVLTEHGIYLRERIIGYSRASIGHKLLFSNFFRALTELAYREADAIAPVCAYNATWELALGACPDKVQVVRNGLDSPELLALAPGGPPGPLTIGYVGRIDPLKDLATLVRAFSIVQGEVPSARLRIWGPATSTEYLRHCQELALRLGAGYRQPGEAAEAAISFEGPTEDLALAYGHCHVVALSSLSEAFPYAVIEAMLAARPVVGTDVGGVSEALGSFSHRLLVQPGDARGMAQVLLALLVAPAWEREAIGAALRQRAQREFDLGGMAGAYTRIYSSR